MFRRRRPQQQTQWVESYLRDNGLLDRVKLLRIYDMSWTRGAAHHTCNEAPVSALIHIHSPLSLIRRTPPVGRPGTVPVRLFSVHGTPQHALPLLSSLPVSFSLAPRPARACCQHPAGCLFPCGRFPTRKTAFAVFNTPKKTRVRDSPSPFGRAPSSE